MLFSRWPFVDVSTARLDAATPQLCAVSGMPVPAIDPGGQLLAVHRHRRPRRRRLQGRALHAGAARPVHGAVPRLLQPHPGRRRPRSRRTAAPGRSSSRWSGTSWRPAPAALPFPEETFFMGDLNISGEGRARTSTDASGRTFFDTPGRVLTDYAVDLWGRRQCTGAPAACATRASPRRVRYPPQEQRLDYIFAATSSRLAAQHMMVDYELADRAARPGRGVLPLRPPARCARPRHAPAAQHPGDRAAAGLPAAARVRRPRSTSDQLLDAGPGEVVPVRRARAPTISAWSAATAANTGLPGHRPVAAPAAVPHRGGPGLRQEVRARLRAVPGQGVRARTGTARSSTPSGCAGTSAPVRETRSSCPTG